MKLFFFWLTFSGLIKSKRKISYIDFTARHKQIPISISHSMISFIWSSWPKKYSCKKSGDAGYRSPYLPHAKRALYHLSYTPMNTMLITNWCKIISQQSTVLTLVYRKATETNFRNFSHQSFYVIFYARSMYFLIEGSKVCALRLSVY